MQDGTYLLTEDFTPPRVDLRSVDWRKRVVPKGRIFHVTRDVDFDDKWVAWPVAAYLSQRVLLSRKHGWNRFFDLLELLPDKPSWYLARHHGETTANRVLDALFAAGRIRIDELEGLLLREKRP